MYFEEIHTLEELRREYRRLCRIHHPDMGGDTATMQKINYEYDRRYAEFSSEATSSDKFKKIIERLVKFDGISIEICGTWIWVAGSTYPIRKDLNSLGFKWHKKKSRWYWHDGEDMCHHSGSSTTMERIRQKYGSTEVQCGNTPRLCSPT